MVATNVRSAFPSALYWSSVGSSTATLTTLVAGLTQIGNVKKTRGTIDVTDMYSTDYHEDGMPIGPVRMAPLSMLGNYLSTSSQLSSLFAEAMETGTLCGWKIVMAGTSSNNIFYGAASVVGFGLTDLTMEGKIGFTLDLKIRGKPFGPVSSTS
jgi:hypothetical protein